MRCTGCTFVLQGNQLLKYHLLFTPEMRDAEQQTQNSIIYNWHNFQHEKISFHYSDYVDWLVGQDTDIDHVWHETLDTEAGDFTPEILLSQTFSSREKGTFLGCLPHTPVWSVKCQVAIYSMSILDYGHRGNQKAEYRS